MYAASVGGKLSVSALVDCLTTTLIPTAGTSSCVAVTDSGIGVDVGSAVGASLPLASGDGDAVGSGLVDACATGVGVRIGSRDGAGSPPESKEPTIMRATPATPRMSGSAQEERRFTCPSLAARPIGR